MGVEDGNVVDIEVDAFRRPSSLWYYECHLHESICPDVRHLGISRPTSVTLGLFHLLMTMFAAVKMEVLIPSIDSHDEGCLAIEFHMLTVSSPLVRPDRPAEEAPVVAKLLSDVMLSSGVINLKELSLISGKAACHGLLTW
ncbi:hypothetical protein MKW92_053438 [Papaver armeniacum]|nr:hypothetical protein MKW92_053438 [Papaver armeniacum]